jgi:hypothetical protein
VRRADSAAVRALADALGFEVLVDDRAQGIISGRLIE